MIKFGLSGAPGSFSEEAAHSYVEKNKLQDKVQLEYLIDMETVLDQLENGQIDLGIFPVANLHGGLVRMAFDAMGRHLFRVHDELWLHVRQCLLAKSGTKIENIKVIASHPQGLLQCREYLQKHFPRAKIMEWIDTAQAAKDLSGGHALLESSQTAVIAPKASAGCYGLEVLAENIQDRQPNLTAFIIVKKWEK